MLRRTTLCLALVGMLVAGLVATAHATPAAKADSSPATAQAATPKANTSSKTGSALASSSQSLHSVPIVASLAASSADPTVDITGPVSCEVSGGTGLPFNHLYDYWVVGQAFYADVAGNPLFRQWVVFNFNLDGIPLPGNKSNVNIRVRDGGVVKWEWHWPDNVHPRAMQLVRPGSAVYTSKSSVDDVVEFQAIFDRSAGSDPRCTVKTPPV